MKLYTVTLVDLDDELTVLPFTEVYTSLDEAKKNCIEYLSETWEDTPPTVTWRPDDEVLIGCVIEHTEWVQRFYICPVTVVKQPTYVCPMCNTEVLGKSGLSIICGSCQEHMMESH